MTTQTAWPPSCRSAPSNCTCCCILTSHTHLSDAAGYPHLNHIIRFPQPDSENEVLAWFHCPHCPCTLGLSWVHPNQMPVVEETMRSASWLPRMADFEAYNRLLDNKVSTAATPESVASPACEEMGGVQPTTILGDRKNETNVSRPSTPLVLRKVPTDGTRRSARKSILARKLETATSPDAQSPSLTLPPYKPRRSKYDI